VQCKDIPDRPILEFILSQNGNWCTWGKGYSMPTVQDAMPEGTPSKLQMAKMAKLIKRGLVHGCPCGCRGDYTITEMGKDFLVGNKSLPTTFDRELTRITSLGI